MPPQLNFKRYSVEDCLLTIFGADPSKSLSEEVFSSEPTDTIPVAQFSATYSINAIPTVRVIPAFGTRIGAGPDIAMDAELQSRIDGAPCELTVFIRFPGEEIEAARPVRIMRGLVSAVSLQDSAVGDATRISVSLEIAHIASILGGAPSSSYVYAGGGTALDLLLQPLSKNPLRSQKLIAGLLGTSEEIGEQTLKLATNEALYPARVLQKIVQALHGEFERGDGSAEAALISTYDPSNLRSVNEFTLIEKVVGRELVDSFITQWRSSNCWDAIRSVCLYFNLRIIPYSDGIYIASAYPLDRNAKLTIAPSEYVTIARTGQAELSKQKRGVRIVRESPLAAAGSTSNVLIFPANDKGQPLPNTYYFNKTYPRFLIPLKEVLNATSADTSTGSTSLKEATDGAITISDKVLRMFYGEEQIKNTAATIRVPFRIDIMPGTVVKIQGSSTTSSVSALGGLSYVGLVLRTTFECDAGQGGRPYIHSKITIGGLRTEEENDSGVFTTDGEVLYEAPWVGIDLSGELLDDLPEHTAFDN